MEKDDEPPKSRTGDAIQTILEGMAAVGKGQLAPTELKKHIPGDVTPVERGMQAVLKAEEILGEGSITGGDKDWRR